MFFDFLLTAELLNETDKELNPEISFITRKSDLHFIYMQWQVVNYQKMFANIDPSKISKLFYPLNIIYFLPSIGLSSLPLILCL